MHELQFSDSAAPQPRSCLRMPLRPYSIGHELLLNSRRNPFITLSEFGFDQLSLEQQCQALLIAVDTCSQTWAQNKKPMRWMRLMVWMNRNTDWIAAFKVFRFYIESGRDLMKSLASSIPEDAEAYEIANKGEKLEGGRACGSPLLAQMIWFAIKELRMSHEECMDAPFAYIGNLYFSFLESKGSMAIENHRELEERFAMATHREEAKAEREAEALKGKI